MTESPHPLLPAATPVLRLDADLLQIGGVDGRPALRVSPAGAEIAALLRRLDGRRSQRVVRSDAVAGGLPGELVDDLLDGLRSAGLLHDLAAADLLAADPGPAATARAAVELPAAVPGTGAGGRWRARRQSAVVIEGATRVGTPLAAVLAASGVGRVSVRDRGTTRAGDAIVGGAAAADEGRPRSLAAADAVRRASPLTDLRPLPPEQAPDLVVLCRPWAAADPLSLALQRAGTPHLVATVRGETGVVGPFVLPGSTGCLRCGEVRRRDADPTWPRLAAQLAAADTGSDEAPAGATITCLLTALTAAVQVLAHLDGAAPGTVDATLELSPPTFLPRLRRWSPHPDCGCGGASRGGPAGERGQWVGE
jgi:bacteriocin biosynthesis cyclodehydratase domain-containing protein